MSKDNSRGIVLLDSRADGLHPPFPNLRGKLEHAGWSPVLVPAKSGLPAAISSHPDVQVCAIDFNTAVVSPELADSVVYEMERVGVRIIFGEQLVGEKYPDDCVYNAVVSRKYYMHGSRCYNHVLDAEAFRLHKESIGIKQGYARCSLMPLLNDVFLTADKGIAAVLRSKGIEHLLFNGSLEIHLPGYANGFLGGCGGCAPDGIVYFSGNPWFSGDSKEQISRFLESKSLVPCFLSEEKLSDIGSLIFFMGE